MRRRHIGETFWLGENNDSPGHLNNHFLFFNQRNAQTKYATFKCKSGTVRLV